MTQTGKPSGPYVSGKYLPKTKLGHQSSADKIIDRTQAAVDVTETVRDMVTCLSTDDIRQLLGVFDELFSSSPDIKKSQPVPSDNKDGPDAMQLSTMDPQSCGDTGQSGLQRQDQGGGDKEEMVLLSSKKSVSKTSSDRKDHLADQGSSSQNKEKAECQVDDVEQLEGERLEGYHALEQKMEAGHTVADTKQLGDDHPLKQGVPVLHKVDAEHLVGDVKPFEMPTLTLELDEKEKPAGDTEPEDDEDTLPYPLEPVQDDASGIDEVTTGCTNDRVLLDEACIHLYDSDRWSELDEDIQSDASKEHTPQTSAKQSRKVQPLDVATTSLEKTKQPVKDHAGDTALSLVSDTAQSVPSTKASAAKNPQRADMLSILIRECANKTPIKKVTDVEHREGSKKVPIFERLSAVQPKTRNVVKDEKESADDHGISLESGDKVKRNDSPQPTSGLPALPEASQSVLSISAEKDEETTRVTVFDRLNTKQPGQEPQKKRVSVFDRLYVPKTIKPEPTLTEPSTLERVSAFDRLSSRKVTKTSTQEKEKQKEDTSSRSSSSKVKKEKTMVKSMLSSKVKKVDSGKATAGVPSTVSTVKPMKAHGVVQKDMLKDVPILKSKKRELPKEDVPANKKYKMAIKDQGDKKDKSINQLKENVTSKKEDKLLSKDPVRRAEIYNDLPTETVASSNKNKQTTKSHGKREEKVIDLQRKRDTSSKKPLPDPRDQARREKKYVDKRSDKRHVSRTHEERKDKEHRRHGSRGRDSDYSSVSTKEDSDTIRKNILKKANDLPSDFSKYVVSGRYLELEGKLPSPLNDPDPVETLSNNITDGAGLDKCSNMAEEKTAVDGYPRKVQSKYVSKTTNVAIQNNEETQPFSVQESYLVLDQTPRDVNYSQVNEQQIHTISVIGGSTANSMRPFHEMSVDNNTITNGLPDDLPLDRIAIMGNREGDGSSSEKIQIQILGEPYNSVSPEPSTILSPETKRAFEQALKGSIGSPTKQDYRPESPTNSISSLSNGHQDQLVTKKDIPPPTSSYEESTSTFTQITYERDEPCQDHEDSRKVKTSLKAPSSRQVYCGNRFHPYDKRLKTFQGHCHNLREPETAELIANFCKEEYRLRKLRAAARVSALSKEEEFFDHARLSPSRFGSLNDMSHDEGVIQRSEEVEMTHSREGAGDAVAGQREDKLQILDKQIKDLTASGSGIQDFFILDANVYPIKVSYTAKTLLSFW